jgi:hypothetical protein
MFTEAELEVINRFRGDFTKVAYNQLKAIKSKYDEEERKNKDCGCSMSRRKIWITNFYEWYEKMVS